MRILFVGDIVGRPGRDALKHHLGHILESRRIDLCIANAENSAAGNGITPRLGEELLGLKIDVLTSGNHIFDKKGSLAVLRPGTTLAAACQLPAKRSREGACGRAKQATGFPTQSSTFRAGFSCLQLTAPFGPAKLFWPR